MKIIDLEKIENTDIKNSILEILTNSNSKSEIIHGIIIIIESIVTYASLSSLNFLGASLTYSLKQLIDSKEEEIETLKILREYLINTFIQLLLPIQEKINIIKKKDETETEYLQRMIKDNPEYLQKILEIGKRFKKEVN